MRLWTSNGHESRRKAEIEVQSGIFGHYIKPNTAYSPLSLGLGIIKTIYVEGINASNSAGDQAISVELDPDGPGPIGWLSQDVVRCTIYNVDLDIDSDNNNEFNMPGRTALEDAIEDQASLPGKLICVNNGDMDNDGIPNFADGFDMYGNFGGYAGGYFTPMIVEIPQGLDPAVAKYRFTYSASDPAGLMRTGSGTPGDPYVYTAAPGALRVWTKNGTEYRQYRGRLPK